MPMKLLSMAEFRAAAKDGGKPDGMVFRLSTSDAQDVATRTVRFVFSDGSVDLAGDTIEPDGWDLSGFKDNPVALFSHMSWEPPIGKALNVAVVGTKLMGDIQFAEADVYPFADTIYRLIQGKYLRAVSVGFVPLEWNYVNDADRYGIDFLRQRLLEISVCSIPCNPNALSEARSKGIDTEPLREWAERVLDTGGQVMVPRNLLEETFKAAKTPAAVRRQYLDKVAAEWKVGASRDLPLDNSDSWDGAAAATRMLDAAGFDGDSPDAARAAKGFLAHDSANPTNRGSYKLPFADIVGGTLKAVKGGVDAAGSRIPNTDVPQSVKDEATTIVDAYQKRFGEGDQQQESLPAPTKPGPGAKSGRRISKANEALLKEAMDYHTSASNCLQQVLDSNESGDATEEAAADDAAAKPEPTEEEKRKQRIREALALRDSIKA